MNLFMLSYLLKHEHTWFNLRKLQAYSWIRLSLGPSYDLDVSKFNKSLNKNHSFEYLNECQTIYYIQG